MQGKEKKRLIVTLLFFSMLFFFVVSLLLQGVIKGFVGNLESERRAGDYDLRGEP